jgi:hypothetical protein
VVEAAATEAAGPARRRQAAAAAVAVVAVVAVLPQPLVHPRLIAPRHDRRSAPAQAGRPRDRVLCLAAVARRALADDPSALAIAPAGRVDPVESALPQAELQVARETSQTDPEQAIDRALEIALELSTDQGLAIDQESAIGLGPETDLTSVTGPAEEIGLGSVIDPEAGIVRAYRIGLAVPTDLAFPIDPALAVPTDLAFPIDPALAVLTDLEFPIDLASADPTDLEFPIDLALAVPTDLAFRTDLALAGLTDLVFPIDLASAVRTDLALVVPTGLLGIDRAPAFRQSLTGQFVRAHLEGSGAAGVGVVGTTPGTVAGTAAAGP